MRIEDQIRHNLASGDTEALHASLAALSAATPLDRPDSVRLTAALLNGLLVEARAFRAHLKAQLTELETSDLYLKCASAAPCRVDVVG